MTSRTGSNRTRRSSRRLPHGAGFTLIEMILVMALLVIVMAYAAPSLSRFFHGRNLDSEARRFLALTRYGQSRAVSEGMPMVLWINPKSGSYGLRVQTSYAEQDAKAVEYKLSDDLKMEAQPPSAMLQTNFWTLAPPLRVNEPIICFLPDGFISEASVNRVFICQARDNDVVWIAQSANRLTYEIQTNQQPFVRR